MVVSELDSGGSAINAPPPDTERSLSMLNQSTTFGDPRLPTRFWDKVRVLDDGCWEWTASRNRGYGRFSPSGQQRDVYAHRYAYEILIGAIPGGLQSDHLCRNRACVNTAHLEVVTNRQNTLRGEGITAQQARQTHCNKGHPFDLMNTRIYRGRRYCRPCRNAWNSNHPRLPMVGEARKRHAAKAKGRYWRKKASLCGRR